ncbi:hypothetical protein D3C74_301380 [compost metagenome]
MVLAELGDQGGRPPARPELGERAVDEPRVQRAHDLRGAAGRRDERAVVEDERVHARATRRRDLRRRLAAERGGEPERVELGHEPGRDLVLVDGLVGLGRLGEIPAPRASHGVGHGARVRHVVRDRGRQRLGQEAVGLGPLVRLVGQGAAVQDLGPAGCRPGLLGALGQARVDERLEVEPRRVLVDAHLLGDVLDRHRRLGVAQQLDDVRPPSAVVAATRRAVEPTVDVLSGHVLAPLLPVPGSLVPSRRAAPARCARHDNSRTRGRSAARSAPSGASVARALNAPHAVPEELSP